MYEAYFFEVLSGIVGLINPESIVSEMIFDANETLFFEILNRFLTD